MRKLASIRKIDNLTPIEGADLIESASIGGWNVIVKKGEFSVGDLAIYCEIDSWIPTEIVPFLSKGKEPNEYMGTKGERLKTIKLKGVLSQGLLLSINDPIIYRKIVGQNGIFEGVDFSEELGIIKYDPPIPACLAGKVKGNFPSYIPKTDQERVQNLSDKLSDWDARFYTWEVTEKLDGSSMTVFLNEEGHFGVCSRNLELLETEENSFWRAARENHLETKLREYNVPLALQGELVGEGIQGNPYKIKGHKFYVYDIYDIVSKCYLSASSRIEFTLAFDIDHVPVIDDLNFYKDVSELLNLAEGKSVLCDSTEREGLVFKCKNRPEISFKAISNKFLLKNGG
jgi:RNA ligase (TIGR02306 family)